MKKTEHHNIKLTEVTPIPSSLGGISKGISASFAGFLDNNLVVIGGCNFPEIPAAQKGKKVFYKDILMLKSGAWIKIGNLPQELAYGVSITTTDAIFCIGGQNNEISSSAVYKISFEKQKHHAIVEELPNLPVTFDNGAGAMLDNSIYIAGGNQNGSASSDVWLLDLDLGNGWVPAPPLPVKGGLVQPVAAGTTSKLYVIGGFVPPLNDVLCEVNHAVWSYAPLHASTWEEKQPFLINEAKMSLSGSAAAVIRDSLILFVGGVNKSVFEYAMNRNIYLSQAKEDNNDKLVEQLLKEAGEYMHHEPDWYRFNNHLWLYHIHSNSWSDLGAFPELALAGTSLAVKNHEVYIINGETKPGIRTPKIWRVEFPE
ncbi:MAG: cyclically-permuted mutarotase family protein [Paludibacter sp.]|nr:cyclically-permuted mutarotase family protein [Paludibacter sp.]